MRALEQSRQWVNLLMDRTRRGARLCGTKLAIGWRMNVSNAFGFVGLGLVMETLPSWAPDVVATRGLDGASTRELWLLFMGGVLIAIGAGYLARVAWAKRPRIVWPEPVREAVREVFRPASAGETRAPARAGRGTRMAA